MQMLGNISADTHGKRTELPRDEIDGNLAENTFENKAQSVGVVCQLVVNFVACGQKQTNLIGNSVRNTSGQIGKFIFFGCIKIEADVIAVFKRLPCANRIFADINDIAGMKDDFSFIHGICNLAAETERQFAKTDLFGGKAVARDAAVVDIIYKLYGNILG